MPQLLHPVQGRTCLNAASKCETVCPASAVPRMKCSARVLELPLRRGLPVMTRMFHGEELE